MSIKRINGGVYIVKLDHPNKKNYGWSSLEIDDINKTVTVLGNDKSIGICNYIIFRIQMRNVIPSNDYYEYYEKIIINFKRGYNSCYHGNIAEIRTFKSGCEQYFRDLDNKL
jgi:hypothetical protein